MRLTPLFLAVLFLLISCAPAIPAPKATTVPPTDISTLTPTPTIVPSATPALTAEPSATPEPTKVPIPDGAIKVADGSVFVETGKVFKINEQGQKSETELSKEVFTDVFDAGDLMKQLHPELFDGDQKALLDFLLPPNTYKDGLYDHSILGNRWSTSSKFGSWNADVTGRVVDLIRLKTPDGFPEGQEAGVLMLAVYGLKEPFPVLASVEKDGKTTLFFEYSRTFNLLKERDNKVYDRSKNYQSLADLASDLLGQRIRDVFPVGVAKVTNAFLDDAFHFQKDNEIYVSMEKYQLEKYGSVVQSMGAEITKKEIAKITTGATFEMMLDRFESDPELRSGFIGFLTRLPWANKYQAE